MAFTITQKPLYAALPVGQQIIFTVYADTVLANYWNVKYTAEVHISNNVTINLANNDDLVATFKTTPNNKGMGIFDFQPLLESYVSPDNLGSAQNTASTYKGVNYTLATPHPLHLIDKYARALNSIRYFAVKFGVEGASSSTGAVATISGTVNSAQFTYFNGVLQSDDYLTLTGTDYGYDLLSNLLYLSSTTANSKFLTNAPTTQYANVDDYGTFGFLNWLPTEGTPDKIVSVDLTYYKNDSTTTSESISQTYGNGGCNNMEGVHCKQLYVGLFPANLRGASSTFQALVAAGTIQGGHYSITPKTQAGQAQQQYIIHVNCPELKNYEPIRLTWLNQWGTWDYYTFRKKSVKSISTNRTTYTQMSGTWNDDTYRINGYKGGKKNFRVNSTEKIKVNTDFVTEEHGVWFEELINSPEVYILKGFDSTETSPYDQTSNKYVHPVLITTSNYTRKTIANDNLIQYTFEMERNKTQKTQTT